jgi:predicted amidohydrolase
VPVPGDVDANLEQHLLLARAAADEEAQVVVFPELSLTGYELDLGPRLAFDTADPRLDPLRELATRHGIALVVGAPARVGARLHLGAFIVSASGAVDLYTKHHLGAFPASVRPDGVVPPPEATFFEAGDLNPLLLLADRTAAVAVCADVGRPAHALAAASRGARCYLASMFVIPADLEQDMARLASHAARHAMTVVFANYGGPSGGLPSAGSSAIWSERGELLARLPAAGAGLVLAAENDGAGWSARTIPIRGR